MKWKNRLTNYNFWISLVSAVLLIVQAFDFKFDIGNINEIATAVLGLLVVIGIISDPTKASGEAVNNPIADSKTEDVKKQQGDEDMQLPNENEIENSDDALQNDFKALINKIALDIDEKLAKIGSFGDVINNMFPSVEGNSAVNESPTESIIEEKSIKDVATEDICKDETETNFVLKSNQSNTNFDELQIAKEQEVEDVGILETKVIDNCENSADNDSDLNKNEPEQAETVVSPMCFNIVN